MFKVELPENTPTWSSSEPANYEALKKRIAELVDERVELLKDMKTRKVVIEKLEADIKNLSTRIKRLVEALEKIAGSGPFNEAGEYDPDAAWSWCYDIANEALKQAEE